MFRIYRQIPALLVLLGLAIANPNLARGYGNGGDGGGGGEGFSRGGGGAGLSNATTKKVGRTLTSGVARCLRVERIYRFDCYRQTYRLAASILNGRPAYTGARKALESVEAALEKIMQRHVDPAVPPKRKGFQTFRAIKPAAVPRATADLSRALDRAETMLLRSPDRTGTHYARIAEAVNSNKVLLRSRLYPDAEEYFRSAFA